MTTAVRFTIYVSDIDMTEDEATEAAEIVLDHFPAMTNAEVSNPRRAMPIHHRVPHGPVEDFATHGWLVDARCEWS